MLVVCCGFENFRNCQLLKDKEMVIWVFTTIFYHPKKKKVTVEWKSLEKEVRFLHPE